MAGTKLKEDRMINHFVLFGVQHNLSIIFQNQIQMGGNKENILIFHHIFVRTKSL
jgi:hypothetical protein